MRRFKKPNIFVSFPLRGASWVWVHLRFLVQVSPVELALRRSQDEEGLAVWPDFVRVWTLPLEVGLKSQSD